MSEFFTELGISLLAYGLELLVIAILLPAFMAWPLAIVYFADRAARHGREETAQRVAELVIDERRRREGGDA